MEKPWYPGELRRERVGTVLDKLREAGEDSEGFYLAVLITTDETGFQRVGVDTQHGNRGVLYNLDKPELENLIQHLVSAYNRTYPWDAMTVEGL